MLGKRSPQGELFRPDNSLIGHVGSDSFYGYLAREGGGLFRDEQFADLYGERGRPSVPPSQLCLLLVLQAKECVSDQEAIDRTAYDIRWKVALGIELEEKLCAKSTLQLFRANLLLNDRYLRLFEASVAACRARGLSTSKKLDVAIDSTPVFGRGAVKDTYNLVSDGIRKVIGDACRLKGWDLESVVAEEGLSRHFGTSFKGESDLDWSDADERAALLAQLVGDARVALRTAARALRGYAKDEPKTRHLRESRELLTRLLAQDVDEDPEDGVHPRIRQGTARDRVISTTDPEMRHGHKSQSKGFDGYKASIVVDTKDGVILSTGVCPGNASDRDNAAELIDTSIKRVGKVTTVLGDTAYGGLDTRAQIEAMGPKVIAKAPPLQSRGGTFKRDRFRVNETRAEAVCPAGKRSKYRTRSGDGWVYSFSRHDCTPCPLRSQCTTSKIRARTITVSERSKQLDKLRDHQHSRSFRRRYRKRVAVEHAIGRLQRGIRQARYFGQAKTALQVAMVAMAANIGLLAACTHFARGIRALEALGRAMLELPPLWLCGSGGSRPALRMALSRPGL